MGLSDFGRVTENLKWFWIVSNKLDDCGVVFLHLRRSSEYIKSFGCARRMQEVLGYEGYEGTKSTRVRGVREVCGVYGI